MCVDKPSPPRNLRAIETGRDYIVLVWDAPLSDGGSSVISYAIEKREAKRAGYTFIGDVRSDVQQFKVTRLFEGCDYIFRITAENEAGQSDPCEMDKAVMAKLPFG